MVTPRSAATSGSKPMMTNSVVPMQKEATASARMGSGMVLSDKSIEAALFAICAPDHNCVYRKAALRRTHW